jgi:hypothetical protein
MQKVVFFFTFNQFSYFTELTHSLLLLEVDCLMSPKAVVLVVDQISSHQFNDLAWSLGLHWRSDFSDSNWGGFGGSWNSNWLWCWGRNSGGGGSGFSWGSWGSGWSSSWGGSWSSSWGSISGGWSGNWGGIGSWSFWSSGIGWSGFWSSFSGWSGIGSGGWFGWSGFGWCSGCFSGSGSSFLLILGLLNKSIFLSILLLGSSIISGLLVSHDFGGFQGSEIWLSILFSWAVWKWELGFWWLFTLTPIWLVGVLWSFVGSPKSDWVDHLLHSCVDIWSNLSIGDVLLLHESGLVGFWA